MTTTDLAEALGVHRNSVVNWVRDKLIVPDAVTLGGGWARWRPSSVPRIRRQVEGRSARSARAA